MGNGLSNGLGNERSRSVTQGHRLEVTSGNGVSKDTVTRYRQSSVSLPEQGGEPLIDRFGATTAILARVGACTPALFAAMAACRVLETAIRQIKTTKSLILRHGTFCVSPLWSELASVARWPVLLHFFLALGGSYGG